MKELSPIQRRLLSLEQTAEILGVSLRSLYNRCGKKSRNPLPFRIRRIGRLVRVDMQDLLKYLESI